MKKITVFTKDLFLLQKIKLEVSGIAEVTTSEADSSALCLFDLDTAEGDATTGALTMSRTRNADIEIPFKLGTVSAHLSEKPDTLLTVDKDLRCAVLRGERIKLTEVEFSLFSLLLSKKGEYADREEILNAVWNGEKDAGVINVYVHYLREKLEKSGEKIIMSSRKCGYKINERYLEGAV